jgi:monothiol glutaredoxin
MRKQHDPARRTAAVDAKLEAYHREVVDQVAAAVSSKDLVVVGMAWNPHVRNVRKDLDEAGFAHEYLEFGNYVSGWQPRLALKMWTGWPTFPQVFVKGTFIGGRDLTKAAIADGTLRRLLDGEPA